MVKKKYIHFDLQVRVARHEHNRTCVVTLHLYYVSLHSQCHLYIWSSIEEKMHTQTHTEEEQYGENWERKRLRMGYSYAGAVVVGKW